MLDNSIFFLPVSQLDYPLFCVLATLFSLLLFTVITSYSASFPDEDRIFHNHFMNRQFSAGISMVLDDGQSLLLAEIITLCNILVTMVRDIVFLPNSLTEVNRYLHCVYHSTQLVNIIYIYVSFLEN